MRISSFISPFLSVAAIVILLLTMSCAFNANALSAITVNTMQGTPPYLTFDGGQTKATNFDQLLSITLSNGVSYSLTNNPSSAANPIVLPAAGQTLADIQMVVPSNQDGITLQNVIAAPHNYWGDDNGDGQGVNGITATGTIMVKLYDANNALLSRNTALNRCDSSYYRVVLSSPAGVLSTKYGYPRTSNFTASSVTYYIRPYTERPPVLLRST
ncbi:hypothetical protein PT273_03230 [Orbaceae bacterium ESL0727]|nr:hypothetical protein [Orbaceae bacterium ESL0727]